MNENSDKNEKLKSHEDDDLTVSEDDNSDNDSDTDQSKSKDANRKTSEADLKQPEKQTLASFFKTKVEREKESKAETSTGVAQEISAEPPHNLEIGHDTSSEEQEENLTNQEVQEATIIIVDARTQEIGEELNTVEPDSSKEFEALAGAVFLETLQDLASGDTEVTPELIDSAFDEALDDLSIEDNAEDAENKAGELPDPTDAEEDSNIPPPVAPIPPITPPVVPPIPPIGPNIATYPLVPPPGGGTTNYNYGPPPYGPNFTPNIPNTPANPNNQPIIIQEIHNHHSDLLLGVIVGYIIGRRGGRKRTEKKLIPKIDNLEEQLKTLHDTIIEKEVLIRKIARENAEMAKKSADNDNNPISATKILERRKTKKQVKEALKRREELAKDPGVEKIGKFSLPALRVFHERRLPDGTENNPSRKRVEVMTTLELLEKVEGLIIHDLKVTEMHERGRLTDDSLRQITKEYLRSGLYEQTFFRELLPDQAHIETLKNQAIEKNNEHSVDETVKNSFTQESPRKNAFTYPNTPQKSSIFKSYKNYKLQKQAVVSGVISAIFLVAILAVYLLVR